MRWMFWRPTPEETAGVERAQRELEDVKQHWPEVREAAATLREHPPRDEYAELIRVAMGVHR